MKVEINPKYEIKPFVREPGRGGAGVSHGVNSNLENITAHTIVLPGHPLLARSQQRGHINRAVNAAFPGPGKAFIQWGIGCYQPAWQNIFVLGDTDSGVNWLLDAINGKAKAAKPVELKATVKPAAAKKMDIRRSSPSSRPSGPTTLPSASAPASDGKTIFTLCCDGRAFAHDQQGKQLWHTQALLEGCALAVSPKGDRLAVAGYPGLLILDTKNGKVLGGFRAEPVKRAVSLGVNRMIGVVWNDAGTLAGGGWLNPDAKNGSGPGCRRFGGQGGDVRPKGVAGQVMGSAFVPSSDTLLLGGDQLTAVDAANGKVLWRNAIKGAQAFAFSADGKTGAAGGWGKSAGIFPLATPTKVQLVTFPSVVGGVALLPGGDLAVAVWGGTHPLSVVHRARPSRCCSHRSAFRAWCGRRSTRR